MEFQAKYITPDIKLSSYEDKLFKSDIMFDQHMLVWFISGETKIIQSDSIHYFKTGDIFLIPRNQLATIINYPTKGLPHKTVVMHLSTEKLKAIYRDFRTENIPKVTASIRSYRNHPLLESCLNSLIPYFELEGDFPKDLADIKIREAISILRVIDKDIDSILSDFDEPGKIDLKGFMEKNFMFNMPIERFGYLTGRSLATFKRDFSKVFNTSPQRWLTQKRLELAHYHIISKKSKPGEIYFEVGFENLSHFSKAFRNQFGYSPSEAIHLTTK